MTLELESCESCPTTSFLLTGTASGTVDKGLECLFPQMRETQAMEEFASRNAFLKTSFFGKVVKKHTDDSSAEIKSFSPKKVFL